MPLPKLAINGQKIDIKTNVQSDHPQLELKHSIAVSGAMRGSTKREEIQLDKDHLVELIYDDDTRWLTPADSLEDIYPGSISQGRDGEPFFELPSELGLQDQDRGAIGKIALKVLNVFVKKEVKEKIVGTAVKNAAEKLEKVQLGNYRGLQRVTESFDLAEPKDFIGDAPFLLFIHGTNSSTAGSFGELKGTPLWDYIVKTYGNNVIAFQHETLTKSPLENVVDLLKQLPPKASLHLISHSRGGLVGEILCRFSANQGSQTGFSKQEVKFLNDEKRIDEANCIKELQKLSAEKKFLVKKFIRVACPTAGTTLVSKRLDHFFNISLNLLSVIPGLGGNAAYQAMKSLLIEVVNQKNKPNILPGLEAMKPDSPFITMLNNQANIQNTESEPVNIGEPVVAISGNCKMKVNFKALFIIASKLFFSEQNDLVVNTKSMYAGSERKDKLRYFFDEGTDVDHFNYFRNLKTNDAIMRALKYTGQSPLDGFIEYSRGAAAERNALLHLEGGAYETGDPSGTKPIVILMPGIMGSVLTKDDATIWINYLRFLAGGLGQLGIDEKGIASNAIIKTSYKKLGDALSDQYDVVTFAFDWRLSMEDSAKAFEKKIKKLLTLGQPIKIVGHSMGGMLARDFMVFCPTTWKTLNASPGFRLIFLGSPLRGSFRINNVLFGEDSIINSLSKIDIIHSKRKLLEMFSTFPGLLCLLPFNTDKENNFADDKVWKTMRDAFGDNTWPIPEKNVLTDFGSYRDSIIKSKDIDFSNAVYIAGHDKETPCGYRVDDTIRGKELVFLSTGEGDQSVTWEMGIPQEMINDKTVYYVNYSHGALSNTPQLFAGIKDILASGKTNLLNDQRPMVRGEQKLFKRPEKVDFDFSEDGITRTILALPEADDSAPSEPPVKVFVSHGDLKYASYPLLAGHFKNDSILYAEGRIDKLLGGLLSDHYKLNNYPGEIGTYEILLSNSKIFPGAMIIGLGEFDKLTSFELSRSAEQAVSKFLLMVNGNQKINNPLPFKEHLGISALIIGCGYGGLSIENSVSAILQAVTNVNAKISSLYTDNAKLIEEVEFVELYEERALSCMYSLRKLSKEMGGSLNITPDRKFINRLLGARKQMNITQNEEWWLRITIKKDVERGLRFSISTGAAREDLSNVNTNISLIENLLEEISTDNNWMEEKAKAVFELLIPNNFKSRLKKHGNIVWVVDKDTAGFPWELLLDNSKSPQPLCINAGMVRQLATPDSRVNIEPVSENEALVIGDPNLNGFLPQLPGALKEANEVVSMLVEKGYKVNSQLSKTYDTIVPALVTSNYKIIHMAGHGVFSDDAKRPSGMVVGKDVYLTAGEIQQMSTSPELVFVNCCFLGKTSGIAEDFFQSRFKLASNIGIQLINNGVKAVVVAGWAVDDAAALAFAKKFYELMLGGETFGEAVRKAREYIYANYGNKNTWGAYHAYGDPYYKLREIWSNDYSKNYVIAAQAEIDLSNLSNDLLTGDVKDPLQKLNGISSEVDKQGIRTALITELEALIYKELDDYDNAIVKFEQLFALEKADYSFTAAEQYCNLKIKQLNALVDKNKFPIPKKFQDDFEQVIKKLESLLLFAPSAERYNLLGSAYKRKIKFYLNNEKQLISTIEEAAQNYEKAFLLRKERYTYSYTNWAVMLTILVISGKSKWAKYEPGKKGAAKEKMPALENIEKYLRQLKKENEVSATETVDQPARGYWDMLVESNIGLCVWIISATGKGVKKMTPYKTIVTSYSEVWKSAGTKNEKLIEVQHLDLVILALHTLKPGHFILTPLKQLRDALLNQM